MDRLLNDITDDLISQIKWGLENSGGTPFGKINFTEDLSDSINNEDTGYGKYIIIDNPYAGFVEYGLPAQGGIVGGGVNINMDQLKSWVFHKLGITDEAENLAVTFRIMKKIQGEGIKPRRFVKKAIKRFISGGKVPRKPRTKKAKRSKFFSKLRKKVKNLGKKIKRISRQATKLLTKADKGYRKIRRYR